MEDNKVYDIVKNLPVARFFYKGNSHSHPVRRTVLLISTDREHLTGYELREGEDVRDLPAAPVKSYRRDCIPRWGDYWRLRRYDRPPEDSTLRRCSKRNLDKIGA